MCVVNVEWSGAFVSCGGCLSQYVLSVTAPTSDCQSSPDYEVMDGSSSVYNRHIYCVYTERFMCLSV